MPSPTRQRIVEAADRMFYENGYGASSFADLAGAVGISRGNFHHHFRTKGDLLTAVVDARLSTTRAMLDAWADETPDPLDRVRRFVEIVATNREDIDRYGCPVGTLTAELAKLDHPERPHAVAVFDLFRAWLREQIAAAGRPGDADELAMHVLAFSQGVATLSTAFRDAAFVRREIERMNARLETLLTDPSPDSENP